MPDATTAPAPTVETSDGNGNTTTTHTSPATETGKGGADNREQSIPRARFDEVNGELRTLKQELEALRRERQEADERKKTEQGEWQQLAEERKSKIAELEPHKERADHLEQVVAAHARTLMDGLPEEITELLAGMTADKQLEWLGKNRAKVLAPTGGARPGNGGGPPPTGPAGETKDREAALAQARQHYPRRL
jgi:hypothetical protein